MDVMNGFMNKGMVEYYKKAYPAGTRIQLDSMADDPNPIPRGTKGSVIFVDDVGTLHCKFDNGRSLGMCPDVDSFHKIIEQEESPSEEQSEEPEIDMSM
jgi:hypothetical protein